jgi:hypothetical protein
MAATAGPHGEAVLALPEREPVRVRACVSPLASVVASVLEVVAGRGWGTPPERLRALAARCRGLDLAPLAVFAAPSGRFPDFLLPPAPSAAPALSEELAALRATPASVIRAQVLREFPAGVPPAYGALLREPRAAAARLADALAAYAERALAPAWPQARAHLEAERAAVERAGSGAAALRRLAPRVEHRDGALRWPSRSPLRAPLGRRQLVLVPLAAGPDALLSITDRAEEVVLAYAAPGVEPGGSRQPPVSPR